MFLIVLNYYLLSLFALLIIQPEKLFSDSPSENVYLSLTYEQKAFELKKKTDKNVCTTGSFVLCRFRNVCSRTLECLLLRDECLLRERVGTRLKTISTNILRVSRGLVLRKFTPAMHRIPFFVPLNSRHSCCSSKQRLVRAETANFYAENKLLPFVQVSRGENGCRSEIATCLRATRLSFLRLPVLPENHLQIARRKRMQTSFCNIRQAICNPSPNAVSRRPAFNILHFKQMYIFLYYNNIIILTE